MVLLNSSNADVNALQVEQLEQSQEVLTQEKDWASEARNKAIALKKARQELEDYKAKLNEYQEKERIAQEEEQKRKGNYEELLASKEKTIKELEEQIAFLSPIKEKYEMQMQKEIEKLTKKIPDSDKDFVEKLIDGKPHDEKIQILTRLTEKLATTYDPRASLTSNSQGCFKPMSVTDFQKLTSDKKKEYMKLSISEHGEVIFL